MINKKLWIDIEKLVFEGIFASEKHPFRPIGAIRLT